MSNLTNGLKNLFPDPSKDIFFVYDNQELGDWLVSKGINACHINDELTAENLISIQTSFDHYHKIPEILSKQSSYSLNIPLLSFDSSFFAAKYICERLFETNFEIPYYSHKNIIDELSLSNNLVKIKDYYINLECNFSENVHYVFPKTLAMTEYGSRSILEYLEIHFEHTTYDTPSEYNINGNLMIEGILCACSPNFLKLREDNGINQTIKKLIEAVSRSKNAELQIKNNQISSFVIEGKEYSNLIEEITGLERKLYITEVAFGLNSGIRKNINWSINSPINEGAKGMHLGAGDGRSGIHIDFISYDLDILNILRTQRNLQNQVGNENVY